MEECLIDAKQRHLPQSEWSSIDLTIASRQLTFVSWQAEEGGKGGRIESSQPNTSKKDKGDEVSVDKEIVVDKPRRLMVAHKGPTLIN